jgi:hypothetical protein
MLHVRLAGPEDAAEACRVIRRSIEDLCGADHDANPSFLEYWPANKTPGQMRAWIAADHGLPPVGAGPGGSQA